LFKNKKGYRNRQVTSSLQIVKNPSGVTLEKGTGEIMRQIRRTSQS